MVDHTSKLVNRERLVQHVFDAADVSEVYAETAIWELFEQVADAIVLDSDSNPYVDDPAMDNNDGDDEDARRHQDSIWARLASVSLVFEPKLFVAAIFDQAATSHLSMALGSTTTNDTSCEVFESKALRAQAVAGAISAGKSVGLTAEHLSKIWCILFDDAARTLKNTSQIIQQNPYALLSWVASNNVRQVWHRKIKSSFYTDTMFATKKAKSLRWNICL